jgi:hypothetical protein
MGVVEKRAVPLELLIYALAANLEQAKQAGLKLGNESHRLETIIQIARNDVINEEEEEKTNELLPGSRAVATNSYSRRNYLLIVNVFNPF